MPSFKESCFEAAKRFVQTAVVIDDEAGYFDVEAKQGPSAPVTAPLTGLTVPLDSKPIVPEKSCISDESELNHTLNIEQVVYGFAELNITCSVQRPHFSSNQNQNTKLKEWALNCAKHSDITIIDWYLFEDDRRMSEDIIIDLLKKDIETGGRVRLLCVYTVQPNPKNILEDIKKKIIKELGLSIVGNKKELACTVDDKIRIVVFNKGEAHAPNKNVIAVPFRELPRRALEEFSILVEGLIPRTALHSIAAVREQTHSLLALMNNGLDGAFCAHRTLIPDTDDSIDYILNLISQEISTKILCDESARNSLDTASIKSWYDGQTLPKNQYALEPKFTT